MNHESDCASLAALKQAEETAAQRLMAARHRCQAELAKGMDLKPSKALMTAVDVFREAGEQHALAQRALELANKLFSRVLPSGRPAEGRGTARFS